MTFLRISLILLAMGLLTAWAWNTYVSSEIHAPRTPPLSFYDLKATLLDGTPFDFDALRGRPVMVVNTASQCGFTSQYTALQQLHECYADDLVILGFPCNDFGAQEPGNSSEIAGFCEKNYGVTFPMMSKIHVGGAQRHPVYDWLCSSTMNGVADHEVKWNFHKFIIDGTGRLRGSFRSVVPPDDTDILNLLFSE